MRKLAPAAFLVSGILVFGGLFLSAPAYATDDEEDETSSVSEDSHESEKPELVLPHPPKDKMRRELEEKYGKQGRLSLPPLVIRPKRETDAFKIDESSVEDDEDTDDEVATSSSSGSTAGTKAATTNKGLVAPSTTKSIDPVESFGGASVGSASAGFIAVNPASKSASAGITSGTQVFPEQNLPIDISNVQLTRKTPADVFFQAAQFGLLAMAGGAVVLGAVAASRAIRRK